jgi:hypothetical protein
MVVREVWISFSSLQMVVREICCGFGFRERKKKRTMEEKMVKYLKYPCHIRGVHKVV